MRYAKIKKSFNRDVNAKYFEFFIEKRGRLHCVGNGNSLIRSQTHSMDELLFKFPHQYEEVSELEFNKYLMAQELSK